MPNVYQKSQNIPIPCRTGLVSTLRDLAIGESVAIPVKKKSSIHPAARRAGVRVTMRTLGDGTVRIWRVAAPQPPGGASAPSASSLSIFTD